MKFISMKYRNSAADSAVEEVAEQAEHQHQEDNEVFYEGNNIFFYGDVTKENVAKLNKLIKTLEKKILTACIEFNLKIPDVYLFIHSDGGCVFSGLSAMNHISSSRLNINTVIDGFVASAATFLSIAGKRRYIMPYSTVLIHQMRTEFYGKHDELKDEVENCDNIMNNFHTIYQSNTKLPTKTLNQLLKRELYLTTEKCIKYEVAHELWNG